MPTTTSRPAAGRGEALASASLGRPLGRTPERAGAGPRRHRGQSGQAALELALVVPLLAAVALAVLQVALLARDQILVVHAAREGARQAAVDASPDAARRGALAGAPLDGDRTEVEATGRAGAGSRVTVRVRYRAPTTVPLVGGLVPDVVLTARATMRVEIGRTGANRSR